jgi:glutaredoxin
MAEDQLTARRVILYGKPGCHLCADALEVLIGLRSEFDLLIDEINIESDVTLLAKYMETIPVLVVNDRVTLVSPIRKDQVRAALLRS